MQHVILDVDGTLWDTTEVVAGAWNHAIEADGNSNVRTEGKQLKTLFGKPMDQIGLALFTDLPEADKRKSLLDACCEKEQKTLRAYMSDLLFPGVKETIQRLVQQGIKVYIVSNCQSGYIELFMEKNQLTSYITDFECFGDTGLQKGENIALLMKRQQIAPKDALYVGDTRGDEIAAREAGISFVFAQYGFGNVENPDYTIQSFSELLHLV